MAGGEESSAQGGSAQGAGGMEALYPFLYAGDSSGTERTIEGVLDEVARSTAEKATEIVELRRQVVQQYAGRLAECAAALATRFAEGGRLFAFGNGGSSTDAQDVVTTFLHPPSGRALPALSLTSDVAVVTALSNDVSFEVVFARQLGAFARAGDIAVGLSTSGGSANVIEGFAEARRRGMLTVGLAGYDGGTMAESEAVDHVFVVPSASVHRIQEAQTTLYHMLWELTQHAFTRMHETQGVGEVRA